MKKNLIITMLLIGLSSCATSFWTGRPKGSVVIKDYSEQMELIKSNFPEIYSLYREGKIMIEEVYTYTNKEGSERVHVNYKHL